MDLRRSFGNAQRKMQIRPTVENGAKIWMDLNEALAFDIRRT